MFFVGIHERSSQILTLNFYRPTVEVLILHEDYTVNFPKSLLLGNSLKEHNYIR